MAFYKRENEQLLTAPNFVYSDTVSLEADSHDQHSYPVDGWYWFDTLDQALAFFAASNDEITMRQCRLALLANNLLSTVENLVQQAGSAAQIEWEYANTVAKNSALVQQLASTLGWDEGFINNLFEQARLL
jgi:hypothetical protein